MPRIVFANPIGGLGGAELFLLEMMSQVRRHYPEWDLHLIAGGEGPLLERAAELGITVHCELLPVRLADLGDSAVHAAGQSEWWRLCQLSGKALLGMGDGLRYLQRLRRLLRRLRPDLLHSNGLKLHVLTGLSCPRECQLVWFMHDYLSSRALMRRALPNVARGVSRLIANSHSVADDVRKVLPRIPIDVLHCGIDLERFSPAAGDPQRLDQLAGWSLHAETVVRIGLVATYARWKGQDIFLQAAAAVQALHPGVRFYLIGGPIYASGGSQFSRAELQEMIEEQGLVGAVGLVPFQPDTPWVYRSLDVFVHASRQPEPFGRTILEAMACGRAVIATQAGGAAEIFEAEVSGLGVSPGSVEELSHAMKRLITDPELRRRLGQQAKVRAASFSESAMGERLTGIYSALLDGKTSKAPRALPHV